MWWCSVLPSPQGGSPVPPQRERERERERGWKARERKKGENNRQGGGWLDLMPEAILFMFLWDGDVERREERGTF